MEPTREVDQAVAALTKEILNLLAIDDAARATSSVTLQNAISRLAVAVVAQATQTSGLLPAPVVEMVLPAVASPEPV